ncbi:MAG TPA: 4Fe-4S cluster-binding domain-containing protein, partial [Candidatus Egerieicola faecale]|nr:4Fe-4S cluster-binding domain-containing protein [Candidatus Egerieicola faecale]
MIHKYSLNGYNIVLDVNSGAVHVVDDVTSDLLDILDLPITDDSEGELVEKLQHKYTVEQITEAYQDVKELMEQDLLFSEDTYGDYAAKMVSGPVKAMCLHIAHDCNLRCKYCFASTGEYGGKRALMSSEVGKKAIDYLLKYSYGRKNLELDFFGGEPT